MTTAAQTIANQAATDFAAAIKTACATGFKKSTGFGTLEYSFEDGSTLALRGGRIEYPQAQRVVFRDACGDLDVRIGA